jgi:hypothetical protein
LDVVKRPTEEERAHFRRIGAALASHRRSAPPASLAQMFERLEALHRTLGSYAQADHAGEHEAELASHVRVIRHLRRRGRERARLG